MENVNANKVLSKIVIINVANVIIYKVNVFKNVLKIIILINKL